jgi:hypothetical protein
MSRKPTKRSATFRTEQEKQVSSHVAEWSADKPFYEEVRVRMGTLIMDGKIPIMPDGRPNLDMVYWVAVFELFNNNRPRYHELRQ